MSTLPQVTRELYQPAISDWQNAFAVLSRDWNERHEVERQRRASIRASVRDWFIHAMGCRRRALEYRRDALVHPIGSRDYEHYRARANEQWAKAKHALARAKRERNAL